MANEERIADIMPVVSDSTKQIDQCRTVFEVVTHPKAALIDQIMTRADLALATWWRGGIDLDMSRKEASRRAANKQKAPGSSHPLAQMLDRWQSELIRYLDNGGEIGTTFHARCLQGIDGTINKVQDHLNKTRAEIRKAWMFALEQHRRGQDVEGTAVNAVESDAELIELTGKLFGEEVAEKLRKGEIDESVIESMKEV